MNEETDTPETLADILAEMRRFAAFAADRSRITPAPSLAAEQECHAAKLTKYADRIEAAAERERDEDRQLAAIAESDEAFARCARCDRPERAPGNAAAMRKALERIVNLAPEYPADGVDWNALAAEAFLTASSAIAAPARNADRFATAKEMARAFLKDPYSTLGRDSLVEVSHRFAEWAFAPAEGGAE